MMLTVFLLIMVSVLTVLAGFASLDGIKAKKALGLSVFAFSLILAFFLFFLMPRAARAQGGDNPASSSAFLAAALSTGLATIGAGYAVGAVGSSALGAVSEDPKILGKTLIYVGLAEGIAIYGLIISIMILGRV